MLPGLRLNKLLAMTIELQTPLRRLADVLPYLLEPRVGIISSLSEHSVEADSPSFFRFNGVAANTAAFGEYRNFAIGGGASTSRPMALAKTIGECVERYCAAVFDKRDFPLLSFEDAPFPCVHPEKFALFSEAQYRHAQFTFDKFTVNSPVRWVPAQVLSSGRVQYVPACMVYVPYFFYEGGDETPIIQPISTGLSCHCTFEEAAYGGICEVIERDNFMITWQAGLSRRKIRQESLSPEHRDLIGRFEAVGYEVHIIDISNESRIPGILAVAVHPNSSSVPIVVAASVSLSPGEAVRKALEELAHTERYAYQIKNELPRLPIVEDFDNVLGQVHHVNFWMNSAVCQYAKFLYSSNDYIDFNELPDFEELTPVQNLQKIVDLLNISGYEALIADITTEDIRELGLHVIRALIPGYHPLFMGYHNRPLGGNRLWNLPQVLGFKGISQETGDTPFPHPFP